MLLKEQRMCLGTFWRLRWSLATSSLYAAVRILPEAFLYNRKCNFLLYKNVLVRYRTRTKYIVVPPYFTDSLRLPASLSRIHSLSTLTGASRHSLLVPASEYISLTFFLIVRLLILHGSGFRCAALGCIRSLFLRAPLTCRLLSVRVYPPLLLPFIAFAYWLYFLYLLLC